MIMCDMLVVHCAFSFLVFSCDFCVSHVYIQNRPEISGFHILMFIIYTEMCSINNSETAECQSAVGGGNVCTSLKE
jgi:hypothetical protein